MIPRSTKAARQAENLALFDFDLSDEEMQLIDGLDGTQPEFQAGGEGEEERGRGRRRDA